MKKGLASVIVCCYNASEFIPDCFKSLLEQTYKKLEVIFVDDGSSDGSFETAQGFSSDFAAAGKELLCLRQENQGVGFACASGLLHASGEYISSFDVDDYLFPESISKRVLFLETHPDCALVRTNGFIFNRNEQKRLFVTGANEKGKTDIFEDVLLGRTNNWSGSYMVRADALWRVFPDHRLPGSRYGQNLQILMSAAWRNKAGFIDEPLMEYRFNPKSFTNQETDFRSSYERILGFWQIRKDILSSLGINDPVLRDKLTLTYDKILMDLCITCDERDKYLSFYDSAVSIGLPGTIHRYYNYLYRGKAFQAFIYRFILFLQNRLHR